ncbi:uncharacterized protein PHACADRAFT_101932, partial [Phanerochaete carnosa HHB-10118-sp]
PGRYAAGASVWIVTAIVLAAFDIELIVGGNGKPVYPVPESGGNFISSVQFFRCSSRLGVEVQ